MTVKAASTDSAPDRAAAPAGFEWLDDPAQPRAREWVDEQDAAARSHLERLPGHATILSRLDRLLGEPWRGVPDVAAGTRVELRRARGADQPSLWVTDEDGERVLVDGAELSADGTVAISAFSLSPDGSLVAWSTVSDGADWQTIRFREARTGLDRTDVLRWIKWPQLAWLGPDRLAYMAFAQPNDDVQLTAANAGAEVRVHQLGTPPSQDIPIYRPEETTWVLPSLSVDGQALLVQEQSGTAPAAVRMRPADLSRPWQVIADGRGPIPLVGMRGDEVIVLDLQHAPNGEVVAVSGSTGRRRVLVPAGPSAIAQDGVHLTANALVIVRHAATGSTAEVVPLDGRPGWQIPLPAHAMIRDVSCHAPEDTVFLEVEEIAGGRRIVRHRVTDESAGASAVVEHRSEAGAPFPILVETVMVTSADGTAVPMRVVRRAGPVPERSAKVLLSVYGGYSVPFAWTGYAAWHLPWLEAGGVLAYAGIRGGGEYGEDWHLAAAKTAKQRGIDDLIACASFFADRGWSEPRSVALNGMSNGGLLVAAALTQRPDLLGAALPEVAVTDMLRFHLFTAGHGWVREFGDVGVPEERAALAAYSPVHRVRPGEHYPPTLLLAADHDDRVPPGPHTYRFAALLGRAQGGSAPVLLRVARNAGHAVGRTLTERVAERTAVLAFAAHALGLPVTGHPARDVPPETEETS